MIKTETTFQRVEHHGFNADDIALCRRVAERLNRNYPGHLWATHLNSDPTGGVLIIRNLAMSSRYGYVLHLRRVYADPDLKCVMLAGGEMLERARLAQIGAGQTAKFVEGMRPQDQPFNGIVI